MSSEPSFTGRTRRRETRRSVRIADKVSRWSITTGGIGTILAVVALCVFLVYVVVPLFGGADVADAHVYPLAEGDAGPPTLALGIDEYHLLAWTYRQDGSFGLHRLEGDRWETLREERPFGDAVPTAFSFDLTSPWAVFGFEDGSVRFARVGFRMRFLAGGEEPAELEGLQVGDTAPWDGGVAQRTPEGQLRVQGFVLELDEKLARESSAPVRRIDLSVETGGETSAEEPLVAILDAEDALAVYKVKKRKNLMTGKVTTRLLRSEVPYAPLPGRLAPDRLFVSPLGDVAYLIWDDGLLQRFTRSALTGAWNEDPETVDLVAGEDARITAARFLVGKSSLAVGDSLGRVRVWFRARPEEGESITTPDGFRFVAAHEFVRAGGVVTALGPSLRGRLLAIAYGDGTVRLVHATSEKEVAEVQTASRPPSLVAIAPREDGLYAVTPGALQAWDMDPGYPEVTFHALFGKVWYEGSPGPAHVWQSTGATNDFEAKLGVMPLIFGTLKATLYSLLFGVPIALLAALFTSEFLSPRVKVPVKSVIEVMASLPSVVLGFMAAMVVAPFVQDVVPSVLTSFLTVPATFLLGAYLWQMLPKGVVIQLGNGGRVLALVAALAVSVLGAGALGPWVERTLFWVEKDGLCIGDIQAWLSRPGAGSSTGGWLLLLLPLCALLATFGMGRWGRPWLRRLTAQMGRTGSAAADLTRFLAGAVLVLGLAWTVSSLLGSTGADPRGAVVGTYIQRNALVVGFVMGFAIIPIIYTLAEDALSSVPSHLREGSLGAGATPWQTATRIVAPTAMSGLFSACMIGLGRAVGETMVVLMAAGNTPVLDWNPFNGFRTLSANIATELPEAVRGDAHYRTLFLTALVLFAMTFVVNTAAEAVRQKFRKRAVQL